MTSSAPKKIVYLSCDNLDGYITDDHLTIPFLQSRGWHVETVSWAANKDWSVFDAAIIRTTWDYTQRLDEFLKTLKEISQQTRLVNCFTTVEWNSRKTYLKDLENWGLKIIPTQFSWPTDWDQLFKIWNTSKIMVKPQVGASAHNTYIITPQTLPLSPLFLDSPLIQPFRDCIYNEGELSFHFFNGHFSHAVRKIPKTGDYRVQEEYGGHISYYLPPQDILDQAQKMYQTIESHLHTPSLFHRVDVLLNSQNQLEIMEVELVEPSLYLRTHPTAVDNFVIALEAYLAIIPDDNK